MNKHGELAVKPPIGDVRDPDSLYHYMQRFLGWRAERNYSPAGIETADQALRWFITWCDDRGLTRPHDVTKPILEAYQRTLYLHRKKDGRPLGVSSQLARLVPIRAWFKWLARHNHILYNPASELDLPKVPKRLPHSILSVAEVENILALPDLDTDMGIRDRAILETFYSTGVRRMEMVHMRLHDPDTARGIVFVHQGKGQKDRVIPIGERALAWIDKYRQDVRPLYVPGDDPGALFLTHLGEAMSPSHITHMVGDYVAAAELGKLGSCHLFRHTMATLMLENGADVRYVQAMLGHEKLETTQIYTQVSIRALKSIHTATHPGKPVQRRLSEQEAALHRALYDLPETDAGDVDALMARLDEEAREDGEG